MILALILFIKRPPGRRSNHLLATLFILIAVYSQLIYLHFDFVQTNNVSLLSYYLPVDGLIMMLMSPCLYFYVRMLLNQPIRLARWSILLHVLPLLPVFLFNLFFVFQPIHYRVQWLINDFRNGSHEMMLINALLYLQIIFYLIISYQLVRKQQKESIDIDHTGFITNINWIRLFLLINILVTVISLPVCFVLNNEHTNILLGQMAMNVDFIVLFVMAVLKNGFSSNEKSEVKKNTNTIRDEQAQAYWSILMEAMQTSKPYLDEKCSLRTLADLTNIPEHQLSKLLNAHGGIAFADFINEYRLKDAIVYLEDTGKHRKTIDAISIECGFGSKSTFYRAFKRVYGCTTKEYLKKAGTK